MGLYDKGCDLMRQVIIARKDLNMSPGKLAAQVAHASWAFLSNGIRKCLPNAKFDDYEGKYNFKLSLDKNIAEDWFGGIFTKTICEAKNKNQLLKAKEIAEELGMIEGKDFFLIKDACNTELIPEEEYGFILESIDETAYNLHEYQNSFMGILEATSKDYAGLEYDAAKVKDDMANPNVLGTLKEVLDKLG